MQPAALFEKILEDVSSQEHFVFSKSDLRNIFPSSTDSNLNMILSRLVSKGVLIRVCKGIYVFGKASASNSTVLYRTASKLRSENMNYISLESVLSENSIISQQMASCLTVMTTGRSGAIECGKFGRIEFVHTAKDFAKISRNLFLDPKSRMLKANPIQAYRDMVSAKRTTLDLISEEKMGAL